MNASELRAAREKLGLTQRQLADRLGTTQATISRWESGAMTIDRPEILGLALQQLLDKRRHKRQP